MTRASLCALAAGVLVAAAVADLASELPRRRRRPARGLGRPLLRILARLGKGLGTPAAPRGLPERVALAGLQATVNDVMAIKAGAALAAALLAAPLAAGASLRHAILLLGAAPIAAFHAPDLWLRRRAK